MEWVFMFFVFRVLALLDTASIVKGEKLGTICPQVLCEFFKRGLHFILGEGLKRDPCFVLIWGRLRISTPVKLFDKGKNFLIHRIGD